MDDQAGRDSDLAAPAEQAGQRHEQAVGALHRTRDAEERGLPAADHGYFFWLRLLMATMHQPNPRTVMRDVKPSAKALGEVTALLDGAARRA
jgi:hypothetical protein